MSDPFAFMGRRGSGRCDEDVGEEREDRQRFVVADDPELACAAAGLLAALRARLMRTVSIELDVPDIASRYGFGADGLGPGVWVLRYDGSVPVAFLVAPDIPHLGQSLDFELFVLTEGVEFV